MIYSSKPAVSRHHIEVIFFLFWMTGHKKVLVCSTRVVVKIKFGGKDLVVEKLFSFFLFISDLLL